LVLASQCWAYRSLTIALNGSAVHAQFPDWPADEAVPIVELMQLPAQTGQWISRGNNSAGIDPVIGGSVSTVGIRTNCACAKWQLDCSASFDCSVARPLQALTVPALLACLQSCCRRAMTRS